MSLPLIHKEKLLIFIACDVNLHPCQMGTTFTSGHSSMRNCRFGKNPSLYHCWADAFPWRRCGTGLACTHIPTRPVSHSTAPRDGAQKPNKNRWDLFRNNTIFVQREDAARSIFLWKLPRYVCTWFVIFVGVTSAKSKQQLKSMGEDERSLPKRTTPTPFRAHKTHSSSSPHVSQCTQRGWVRAAKRFKAGSASSFLLQILEDWTSSQDQSLLTSAGNNENWGTGFVLVCWKQVPSRWQRCQTSCDIGQQWQVWKALDVGFQLLAHLGYPSKLLFIFLRERDKRTQIKHRLINSAVS